MKTIKVREIQTPHKVVHEIDVTGRSERQIERVSMGMQINLNRDAYFVDDACEDEPDRPLIRLEAAE